MKNFIVCLSILLPTLISSRTLVAADFRPSVMIQAPENVFVPMGFDSNDNAQLVLYANLPDTCHKAGPVRYRIDKEQRVIYIRNEIYFYSGCWCADVLVPYIQTVNLGVLRDGNYSVVTETPEGGFEKMASLAVGLATTSSPDDHLYAPVENIHLSNGHRPDGPEVVLGGTFRNSCMYLKDIKVNYRPNHVIEILPIAAIKTRDCQHGLRPFTAAVKIKVSRHGRTLIHVRSLNGQALNQVVDL